MVGVGIPVGEEAGDDIGCEINDEFDHCESDGVDLDCAFALGAYVGELGSM
ncbi:MAG: hypothetical protein ACXV5H_09305 [Halobacteriota archaeon]